MDVKIVIMHVMTCENGDNERTIELIKLSHYYGIINAARRRVFAMSICLPVKELKDTAAFTQKVLSANEPVIVTKNGKESFIAMSPAQYEGLRSEAARSCLLEITDNRMAGIAAGQFEDASATLDMIKQRYGL